MVAGRLLEPAAALAAPSGAPPLVVAQGLSDVTAQVAWMAVPGAERYRVYRDGTLLTELAGTLIDDAALGASTSYSYTVTAVSGGVESAPSDPAPVVTQVLISASAPTRPGTIDVSKLTASSVRLSWGPSTDDVGIVGYRIVRSAVGGASGELVQISTTDAVTSYTATALRSDTTYTFGVIALDVAGNKSPIRTVTLTTQASQYDVAPAAPSSSSVAATAFSSSRIDLVWGAATSSDVAGYEVFRDGVRVGGVERPARKTFSDVGLAAASSHVYTIRTVDFAGNVSPFTTGRTAKTLAVGFVKIARGPYLQWVTPTSARIAWWTNLPTISVVEYGIGGLTNRLEDLAQSAQHMLLVGELTPGATYQYRIGDGTTWSAVASFASAPAAGSSFAFAAVGDFGGGSVGETQVANGIAAAGTQFVQTLGDNVYPDAQDPDFLNFYSDFDSRFYKPWAAVIRAQAFWIANGNKEYYGDGAAWNNFWMPNNERWYSYDWGDLHMLVLDAEHPYAPGTPQYAFAQADLAAAGGKLKVVVIPRPPYSSTSANSSSEPVQRDLVPLFEQAGVRLVLSGNSHNYERTYPLIGGAPATGGVVYIVCGNGGNGFNKFVLAQPSWSAYRVDSIYGYVRIGVSPSGLQLTSIQASDGAVLDSALIAA